MSIQNVTHATTAPEKSPWRSVGVWLTLLLIVYILFNAVRATLSPLEFAATFGVPLDADNTAFVLVYAIRALFLGLFGLALVLSRNFAALAVFVLVAVVMPLGDAALVASLGGPAPIVARHLLTAVLLFVTWLLLRRWLRRSATT